MTLTITTRLINDGAKTVDGKPCRDYGLYADGKGRTVAVVEGEFEVYREDHGNWSCDMVRIAGKSFCVWQALDFAKAGTHGLRIVG